MIASWMLYTLVVGLLVTLAALAAERALGLLGRPVRGVWAFALVLSLLIPALSPLVPRRAGFLAPVERVMTVTRDAIAAPLVGPREEPAAGWWPGRALLIGWLAASVAISQLVLFSMAVLHGRRREWRRQEVDGTPALISPDFGPAVIGWRRLEIVLPAWTLDLAPDARALVVRHEREHIARGDPRLLLYSFLMVIAMPWNPFLWLQFRRLRRAIEIDCDARVIGSGVPVARYGEVLLEAVGLCRSAGLPALASFAERAKDLEARIEALTRRLPARRGLRMALAGGAALMLGAAACVMPDPLSPEAERVLEISRNPTNARQMTEWVEHYLAGRRPVGPVVMVRASTGEILAIEETGQRDPTGKIRPGSLISGLDNDDIASIEVLKGRALGIPDLEGLIVISLKPGVQLRKTAAPAQGRTIGATWYTARPDTILTLGKYVRALSSIQFCAGGHCAVYRRRGG